MNPRPIARRAGALGAAALAGCALLDVRIADPEDVIIAEVQVLLTHEWNGNGTSFEAGALLHRTFQREETPTLRGSTVVISEPTKGSVRLEERRDVEECVIPSPQGRDSIPGELAPNAVCYRANVALSPFDPGDRLSLEITAPDGRVLVGSSLVPGAFDLVELDEEDGRCRLDPDTNYRFQWRFAENAWSYLADARLEGLRLPMAQRDIDSPDTLYLLGFAIDAEDSTLVFSSEFGIFEFFAATDEERDVIRELRRGLPGGVGATVAMAAADRNWVNWERGGNFNPSGEVRIPSVFGDGTGVFSTATRRVVRVRATEFRPGAPPLCGPAVS
ncbi:MAG: hypothetical protein J4F34_02535 [Gemmatimonadetes bacterium]|nr:hypothetical protein [Gemmatimonadota bacterium]